MSLAKPGTLESARDRFADRVRLLPDGCWQWLGNTQNKGYGVLHVQGKLMLAHRFAYSWFVGPIPRGLELDHACSKTDCVNPAHLEAVTHRENVLRGRAGAYQGKKKTCPYGRPYTEKNTYRLPSRPTHRNCVTCLRKRNREHMRARRALSRG